MNCELSNSQTVLEPLGIDEACNRFANEAKREVFAGPRYDCQYFEWGEGPPLVFVHGMGDNSYSFLLPIAELSRSFRCIAYDLPLGIGDRARLANYVLDDYVADLMALLDHIGLDKTYLYGSSLGSTIALKAMHQYPDRFPRGLLQGAFARRPLSFPELMLSKMARYWPGRMGQLPLRQRLLERLHKANFSDGPVEYWDFYLQQCNAPPIFTVARRGLMIHGTDLRGILAEIRQPILLITGLLDPLVGKACAEVLMRGLPNAAKAEMTNAGHFPYFSHPHTLAQIIDRWLTPVESCSTAIGCNQPTGCSGLNNCTQSCHSQVSHLQ